MINGCRMVLLLRILTSNSNFDADVDEDEQCKEVEGTQAENLLVFPAAVRSRVIMLGLPQLSEAL